MTMQNVFDLAVIGSLSNLSTDCRRSLLPATSPGALGSENVVESCDVNFDAVITGVGEKQAFAK